MLPWKSDDELFATARGELFPAVVGDVMDKMGLLHQFLPPAIRPARDDMVVVGRAMPVLEADVFFEVGTGDRHGVMAQPFGLMFRALDDLQRKKRRRANERDQQLECCGRASQTGAVSRCATRRQARRHSLSFGFF